MSEFIPITGASHLSYVVPWIQDGHVESTSSPLLAANMATEPPEILPVVWTEVPPGCPSKRLLHDSVAKVWFDLETGQRYNEWKAATASLWKLWDAAQPAPQPAAPAKPAPLEVPLINEPQHSKPPHRLNTIPHPRDVQE